MDNKELLTILKRCLNNRCDDSCPLWNAGNDCHNILLNEIIKKMQILPEDYLDWCKRMQLDVLDDIADMEEQQSEVTNILEESNS